MAKFRVITVFETEIDDESFTDSEGKNSNDPKEWARQTEEDFRDDPENFYNVFDSEVGQPDFSVSVVPLD